MKKIILPIVSALLLVAQDSEVENLDSIQVQGNKRSIFEIPTYFDSQTYINGAPSQKRMDMSEAMNLPGVMSDPLKAISTMAGVTTTSSIGSEMMIHGSKPYESLYTLNYFPLGYTYHFGAFHSVLASNSIEQMDIYLGAFDVSYGNAMGGVVDITPKTPSGDNSGHIHAGLFDSSFSIDYGINDKVALFVAGRRTYYDVILELANKSSDKINIDTYPNYYDLTSILSYIPDYNNIFTFEMLMAQDTLSMSKDAKADTDPDAVGAIEDSEGFATYALRWRYDNLNNLKSNTILSYRTLNSEFTLFNTFKTNNSYDDFFINNLTTLELESHKISTGFEYTRFYQPFDFSLPARFFSDEDESPASFSALSTTTIEVDQVVEYNQLSIFLQDIYSITDDIQLRYGTRASYVDYQNFGSVLNPRAALVYKINKHSFSFATGKYSQLPEMFNTLDNLGSSNLSYESSIHYALNYTYNFTQKTKLEFEPYYKKYTNLAISTNSGENYVNGGEGRSKGIDLTFKSRSNKLYFYSTYSYLDAKRETSTTSGISTMNDEIPHTFQVAASYDIGSGWLVSSLFKYQSGQLYTPIEGTVIKQYSDNSIVDTYVDGGTTYYTSVLSDDTYSQRLPDYYSLNLKISKTKKLKSGNILEYSFELMNATNHINIIRYTVDKKTGAIESLNDLPILPWFDVTYRF